MKATIGPEPFRFQPGTGRKNRRRFPPGSNRARPARPFKRPAGGSRRVRISGVHTDEIERVVTAIISARANAPATRALLVGISGIDASGKGFVTAKLACALEERGWNIAAIGVDGWLNLP